MPLQVKNVILYNVKDLADVLGIAEGTVRKYFREGKIKGRKLARSWYVTEENLKQYLRETDTPLSQPLPKARKVFADRHRQPAPPPPPSAPVEFEEEEAPPETSVEEMSQSADLLEALEIEGAMSLLDLLEADFGEFADLLSGELEIETDEEADYTPRYQDEELERLIQKALKLKREAERILRLYNHPKSD